MNMYQQITWENLSSNRLQDICTKGSEKFRIKAEQELLLREDSFLEERLYMERHHHLDLNHIETIA